MREGDHKAFIFIELFLAAKKTFDSSVICDPILAFVSYHLVLGPLTCHIGSWLLFPLLSDAKNENLMSPPYSTTYQQDIL